MLNRLLVIFLICLVSLETILAPSDMLVPVQSFPFVTIGGFSFTISSLILALLSLWVLVYTLPISFIRNLRVFSFAVPRAVSLGTLWFLFGLGGSLVLSVFSIAPSFTTQVRNLFSLAYVWWLFRVSRGNSHKEITTAVLVCTAGMSTLSLLSFVSSGFAQWFSKFTVDTMYSTFQTRLFQVSTGAWSLHAGTIGLLLFCLAFSRILFAGGSFWWYVLAALGMGGGLAFIGKANVLMFAVIIVTFLVLSVRHSRLYHFLALAVTAIALLAIALFVLSDMWSDRLGFIQSYVVEGYLNIGRGQVEGDLSSGRFGLWAEYLADALRGYGTAPNGFGNIPEGRPAAHNMVVFFAYHTGLLPTIGLVVAVVGFVGLLYRRANVRLASGCAGAWRQIGCVVYVIAFLVQGLVLTNWFVYNAAFFAGVALALACLDDNARMGREVATHGVEQHSTVTIV